MTRGSDALTPEEAVVTLLRETNMTLSTAESCTGGAVAARLVNVPGASEVLRQGFVTYSNKAKRKYLMVKKSTLKSEGAVSAKTAREMAKGGCFMTKSDACIAVTGIAGPGGGTEKKPVGLVYVGVASANGCETQEMHLRGERDWIRELTCVNALNALRLALG